MPYVGTTFTGTLISISQEDTLVAWMVYPSPHQLLMLYFQANKTFEWKDIFSNNEMYILVIVG